MWNQLNKFDKNLEANTSEHIPSPLSKNRLMWTSLLSRMVCPMNSAKVLSLLNHHSLSKYKLLVIIMTNASTHMSLTKQSEFGGHGNHLNSEFNHLTCGKLRAWKTKFKDQWQTRGTRRATHALKTTSWNVLS